MMCMDHLYDSLGDRMCLARASTSIDEEGSFDGIDSDLLLGIEHDMRIILSPQSIEKNDGKSSFLLTIPWDKYYTHNSPTQLCI